MKKIMCLVVLLMLGAFCQPLHARYKVLRHVGSVIRGAGNLVKKISPEEYKGKPPRRLPKLKPNPNCKNCGGMGYVYERYAYGYYLVDANGNGVQRRCNCWRYFHINRP